MSIDPGLMRSRQGASGGHQIEQSIVFDAASLQYMTRTPASAGNRQKFTMSCWIKVAKLPAVGISLLSAGTGNLDVLELLATGGLCNDNYDDRLTTIRMTGFGFCAF